MKKKYRLFGVINPIDVLLIIAVLLLLWGAYMLARPQAVVAEGGTLIRYTFEISERPEGFYQTITPGTPAYCGAMGWRIGTVVYAYAKPFMQDAPDESAGIFRRAEVEGMEFTYIVIEAWANVSDHATHIGQYLVAVNRQVPILSKDFGSMGFITNLEWMEEVEND